ncbi:hypothetical protein [Roseibium sediminicola]|uniref:Uncharacterized protein n=1 Tax=Roseibium sediminicola TaxID=2933272 RepID=A0ABT0H1T5_9HYPH|nr:hypothetical protein [Roseibium sp. CAU 1639]MCK7615636.1 hypothetical protein [Roseibium sp. CAU 1639]
MSPSSCEKLEQAIHQQGLGYSFKRLIGAVFARQPSGRHNRQAAADLPASLRHDIGLGPDPVAGSFEDRWLQELKCLQR